MFIGFGSSRLGVVDFRVPAGAAFLASVGLAGEAEGDFSGPLLLFGDLLSLLSAIAQSNTTQQMVILTWLDDCTF
jgi:hypothetical protein